MIDGDAVRELYGSDLLYTEEARVVQIKRLQNLANYISSQGQIVIVAALYSHPDLLKQNRVLFNTYFEVYIEASLGLLRERDPKGLYSKADKGEMPNVVGLDIPWHAPKSPDMHIVAGNGDGPEVLAKQLAAQVPFITN